MIHLKDGVPKRKPKPLTINTNWQWNQRAREILGTEQIRKANAKRMLDVPEIRRYIGPGVKASSLGLQKRPVAIDIANSAYVLLSSFAYVTFVNTLL